MSWLKLLTEIPRALLALRDIINVIDDWWKRMEEKEREKWRNEVRSAMEHYKNTGDQRELEEKLGSDTAGKMSNTPGSVFIPDGEESSS